MTSVLSILDTHCPDHTLLMVVRMELLNPKPDDPIPHELFESAHDELVSRGWEWLGGNRGVWNTHSWIHPDRFHAYTTYGACRVEADKDPFGLRSNFVEPAL